MIDAPCLLLPVLQKEVKHMEKATRQVCDRCKQPIERVHILLRRGFCDICYEAALGRLASFADKLLASNEEFTRWLDGKND